MFKWEYDIIGNPWLGRDVFNGAFFNLLPYPKSHDKLFKAVERGKDLYLEAPVPGLEKDELSIKTKGSTLTIKGETKDCNEYSEKYSFTKQYKLPDNIDLKANEPEAELKNGILRIKFNGFYEEVEPPEKKEFDIPIK